MPGPSDLPEDLQSLARRNAAQVRHDPDFHSDMRRLVTKIEDYFVSRNILLPQSAAEASHPALVNGKGYLVPAILSGLGGLVAIVVGGAIGGEPIDYGIGILLFAVGGLLFSRQVWAWGIAIAMQVVAIILCGMEAVYSAYDDLGNFDPTGTTVSLALIPVIALITLITLLLPRIRRSFH
jgi:hypothetical protein